jgi:hypothetical protein
MAFEPLMTHVPDRQHAAAEIAKAAASGSSRR